MTIDSMAGDNGLTSSRPTSVRLGVLAFLSTLALLLYVDRVCIGQAEQSIREDLGLTAGQMSCSVSFRVIQPRGRHRIGRRNSS